MALLVRLVLLADAPVAELLVAREAPNFGVVQGMVGLALIATVVGVIALFQAELENERASGHVERNEAGSAATVQAEPHRRRN